MNPFDRTNTRNRYLWNRLNHAVCTYVLVFDSKPWLWRYNKFNGDTPGARVTIGSYGYGVSVRVIKKVNIPCVRQCHRRLEDDTPSARSSHGAFLHELALRSVCFLCTFLGMLAKNNTSIMAKAKRKLTSGSCGTSTYCD